MYICQLGDGLMLSRHDKYFRIENTGYPYPTIEYNNKIKSQSKLLYNILNDIDLEKWLQTPSALAEGYFIRIVFDINYNKEGI